MKIIPEKEAPFTKVLEAVGRALAFEPPPWGSTVAKVALGFGSTVMVEGLVGMLFGIRWKAPTLFEDSAVLGALGAFLASYGSLYELIERALRGGVPYELPVEDVAPGVALQLLMHEDGNGTSSVTVVNTNKATEGDIQIEGVEAGNPKEGSVQVAFDGDGAPITAYPPKGGGVWSVRDFDDYGDGVETRSFRGQTFTVQPDLPFIVSRGDQTVVDLTDGIPRGASLLVVVGNAA